MIKPSEATDMVQPSSSLSMLGVVLGCLLLLLYLYPAPVTKARGWIELMSVKDSCEFF